MLFFWSQLVAVAPRIALACPRHLTRCARADGVDDGENTLAPCRSCRGSTSATCHTSFGRTASRTAATTAASTRQPFSLRATGTMPGWLQVPEAYHGSPAKSKTRSHTWRWRWGFAEEAGPRRQCLTTICRTRGVDEMRTRARALVCSRAAFDHSVTLVHGRGCQCVCDSEDARARTTQMLHCRGTARSTGTSRALWVLPAFGSKDYT